MFKRKISRQAQKELDEIKRITKRITELTDALNKSKAEVKEFSPKAGAIHVLLHGRLRTDPADAKRLRDGRKGVSSHSKDIDRCKHDREKARARLDQLLDTWAEHDAEYKRLKNDQSGLEKAKQACTTMSSHIEELRSAIADSSGADADRVVAGIGTIEEYTPSFNRQVKGHGSLRPMKVQRVRDAFTKPETRSPARRAALCEARLEDVAADVAGIQAKIEEELADVASKVKQRLTQIRSGLESQP